MTCCFSELGRRASIEFGWKTTLANGSLRFNGSVYQIDWDKLQVGVTDFECCGVLTFVLNVGNAEIRGFEGDLTWLATDQLTLGASWSINKTELLQVPDNITGLAPVGSDLALAPELQYNINARYQWELGNKDAHAQLVVAHTDDQYSSVVTANRFKQKSYDSADKWGVELFAENLTDERAELFINALDTDLRITTNRPRTWGVRVSYDF
jgi:outer membrane receptor protein involved in Fe transport